MKNILVISDTHCGHVAGLTPPGWQMRGEEAARHPRIAAQQRAMWKWYAGKIAECGPFDILVCLGDAIDGAGKRSGGVEQITTDRDEQVAIAGYCIREALTYGKGGLPKTRTVLIAGTPYHTGAEEDWESVLARDVLAEKGKACDHEWVRAEGVVLDCKHKIGGSSIPHGRGTSLLRSKLWNTLWADRGQQPDADVLLRGHVHYHAFAGDRRYLSMTAPCLKGHGDRYGARQCEGTIDLGFLTFRVDGASYSWKAHIMDSPVLRAKELVL
jgi:predicted phosphodiesterase